MNDLEVDKDDNFMLLQRAFLFSSKKKNEVLIHHRR